MTWTPNAVVTIDGVDFTGNSLNGLNITMGRTSVWDQPRAGYCNVELVNLNDSNWSFGINDVVTIQVDDSSGNPVTLFTGKLQNVSNSVDATGSNADVVIQQVTAYGVMSEMSRIIIGGTTWAKEYDDVRIDRIFTDSGVPVSVVDSPGVYQFTSIATDLNDSYSFASYYANMAFGYIYENALGEIGYANESRRTLEVAANGYLNIPTNVILGRSVSSEISFRDLLNDLTLEYKNNQIVTSTNATSITNYGKAAAQIRTELEDSAEAQFQADRYVGLRSIPQTNINSFTIQLDASTMTNALLDDLLAINIGLPIQIQNLPTGILHTIFQGFVENHIFTINENQAQLTILATDSTYSITPTRWQDVSASLVWSAVDPTLQWFAYE